MVVCTEVPLQFASLIQHKLYGAKNLKALDHPILSFLFA
ncbi:protein of unknown function [Cardinium endosymbiont cEper1 of Encarsia pergandiella]|nr:protein of unknown function [Cardinium endosymbiont cEper1 of Encarsia pergandiella]